MNLIEKSGLEKCKEIVDGAPAIANFYIPSKAGYTRMGSVLLVGDNSKVVQMVRDIADNCSDIANHISPLTKVIDK